MDGVLNHFLPSVLYCRIMHIQSLKFSRDDIPLDPAKAPPVFAHRHQFPLGSPAFPLFLFYKTTTGAFSVCTVSYSRPCYCRLGTGMFIVLYCVLPLLIIPCNKMQSGKLTFGYFTAFCTPARPLHLPTIWHYRHNTVPKVPLIQNKSIDQSVMALFESSITVINIRTVNSRKGVFLPHSDLALMSSSSSLLGLRNLRSSSRK